MSPQQRRYWVTARGKVMIEGACRVDGRDGTACEGQLEAAHVLARQYDPSVTMDDIVRDAALGDYERIVERDDVVPLCRRHHGLYDAHKLDLLPYLSYVEQAAAVRHVGIVRALRRITSSRES